MITLIFYATLLTLITSDVALGKSVIWNDDGITIHKVIATWQEAQQQCQNEGTILASPINVDVLNLMKSKIGVNNTAYFIGTRASRYPGPYVSVEGLPLENMTAAVMQMIQQLDPRDGDCLSMDRYSIRVVSCCLRLPYMCYKTATEGNVRSVESQEDQDQSLEMAGHNMSLATTRQNTSLDTTRQQATSETDQNTSAVSTEQNTWTATTEQNTVSGTGHNESTNTTVLDISKLSCDTDTTGYTLDTSTSRCYKVHQEYMTWDQGEATCIEEGGHLAVPDDENEARAFSKLGLISYYPNTFIGIRDKTSDYDIGDWRSVHGKPVEELFNVWNKGEKPRYGLLKCAVFLIYIDKLDIGDCDTEREFICEKDPINN